ncbi:Nicotianamine synthase [Halteromyces radiatus]|uniref:Nicotianamine synthase n=1 Tax=Halteromyces radiatus TaxID=101107 RepID=UPI00221E7BC2|nr:Nicotianamine synthase [Halteromyces radiatus]KAI8099544.1 Nicotianamine synthase [Halteromyces radiatus]
MVHHTLSEVTPDYSTRSLKSSSSHLDESSCSTVNTLVTEINHIYHQLAKAAPHLQPSEHINALFSKLVQICIMPVDQPTLNQVLAHPTIRQVQSHLRQLCSQGEYLLESNWSRMYIQQEKEKEKDDKWEKAMIQQLSTFTYYGNYVDLTRLECHALLGVGANLGHIVWVGSGPLPLSSIEMMLQHHTSLRRMDMIDISPEAIQLSSQLIKRLPWPSTIQSRFHHHVIHASAYPDYHLADVVCLGALVGDMEDDNGKLDVIYQVIQNMRPGAWLLIRSAHGLRQLLYPALVPSLHLHTNPRLVGLLEIVLELHPHHDVVNSVLIARRIG